MPPTGYRGGSGNPKLSACWIIPEMRNQAVEIVTKVLRHTGGDVKAAAKILQISRTTLNRWIDETPELTTALTNIRSIEREEIRKMRLGE